jgi:hypothetical protein
MRLGKREAVEDPNTMALGDFIDSDIYVPSKHNFDKRRAAFPLDSWGNDAWGNCVKVGQANQTVRFERIEGRRTVKISAEDVIEEYKAESLRQFGAAPEKPGDTNDDGLVLLTSLRNWRKTGWTLLKRPDRQYKIAAFGCLDADNPVQMKQAIYLLHGIQIGFELPKTAKGQIRSGTPWEFVPNTADNRPRSWGGHLVYAKAYDENFIEVLTWGKKQLVSWDFMARYADEVYATVDTWDEWRTRHELDVDKMISYLHTIGVTDIE